MSKMFCSIRTTTQALALCATLSMLSACGGGSAETAATPAPVAPAPGPVTAPPEQAATVVGVQTPDNVSVVTATNAN